MRAHLFDGLTALVAAVFLIAAVTRGGPWALLAGLAAVFFEGATSRLWQALLDSLNPRTDAEAKYLKRVGRDILERHRQKEVQDASSAVGGGA
jgi:hypothetical protein